MQHFQRHVFAYGDYEEGVPLAAEAVARTELPEGRLLVWLIRKLEAVKLGLQWRPFVPCGGHIVVPHPAYAPYYASAEQQRRFISFFSELYSKSALINSSAFF